MAKKGEQTEFFHEGQHVRLKRGAKVVPTRVRRKFGRKKLVVFGTCDCPGNGDQSYSQTVSLALRDKPEEIIGYLSGSMLTRA